MEFERRNCLQLAVGAAIPAVLATMMLLMPASEILLGSSVGDCNASNCGTEPF